MRIYIIDNDNVFIIPDYLYSQYNTNPRIFESSSEQRFENYKDDAGIVQQKLINPWTFWDDNTKIASIRLQRDYLLKLTDWRTIKSVDTEVPESQAWKNYRQSLRDFPNTVNVNLPIEQIVWPTPPNA
jgi:hypothetical protein